MSKKYNSNIESFIEDLIWAREMLRVFFRMEKDITKHFGEYGKEKLLLLTPAYISLSAISIFIGIIGIYFFIIHSNIYFLTSLGIPLGTFYFLSKMIKKETKKNIFRFLRKQNYMDGEILSILESLVFKNRENFETIIAWNSFRNNGKNSEKFRKLLDRDSWLNIESAKKMLLLLAILMVELQKFLNENKKLYDEHVKKIPLMNPGSNIKHSTNKEFGVDMTTFESGFTKDTTIIERTR